MTSLKDIKIIDIPVIEDFRGNLAVIEGETVPFDFKRVYYLYDVPCTSKRGGHSHKTQSEVLIATSGSFEVILDDGKNRQIFFLNKPNKGLVLVPGIWREISNFSSGSVCMVLSSSVFNENDYIRDYNNFLASKQ